MSDFFRSDRWGVPLVGCQEVSHQVLATARLAMGLALALVMAFGVLDVLVQPEITGPLWLIRYGIMSPCLALLLLALHVRRLEPYVEWGLLAIVLVGGGGILAVIHHLAPARALLLPCRIVKWSHEPAASPG